MCCINDNVWECFGLITFLVTCVCEIMAAMPPSGNWSANGFILTTRHICGHQFNGSVFSIPLWDKEIGQNNSKYCRTKKSNKRCSPFFIREFCGFLMNFLMNSKGTQLYAFDLELSGGYYFHE